MTAEKQRRTFISYSRVNNEFAVKLAKELRADALSESGSIKGFFSLSIDQHGEDQAYSFIENGQPIPLTLTDLILLRLGYSDCARTVETLDSMLLEYITYIFEFNGKKIPESDYASYDYEGEDSSGEPNICRVTYVIIGEWIPGSYPVPQSYSTTAYNDGYDAFEAESGGTKYIIIVP